MKGWRPTSRAFALCAPRPLGKDEHGGAFLYPAHRFFNGLQGFPRVVPVDADVTRPFHGPAEEGYAEKLALCDELEGDGQGGKEHGDIEGALVIRHEEKGGFGQVLRGLNGNADAGDPEVDGRPKACDPVDALAFLVEGRDARRATSRRKSVLAYEVQVRRGASSSRLFFEGGDDVLHLAPDPGVYVVGGDARACPPR